MFKKLIFYVNSKGLIHGRLSMFSTDFKRLNGSFIFVMLNYLSLARDSRWTPYERKEVNAVYWEFPISLIEYFLDYFGDVVNANIDISKLKEWKDTGKIYEDSNVTVDS